jgi:multicomponent Na+:H+ antiporter subunit C
LQTYRSAGSVDTRDIDAAERLGSPFPATKDRP